MDITDIVRLEQTNLYTVIDGEKGELSLKLKRSKYVPSLKTALTKELTYLKLSPEPLTYVVDDTKASLSFDEFAQDVYNAINGAPDTKVDVYRKYVTGANYDLIYYSLKGSVKVTGGMRNLDVAEDDIKSRLLGLSANLNAKYNASKGRPDIK